MYLLKLNIVEHCLLVEKNDEEAWLWYKRMCHQSAYTLHGILKGNHAIGLLVLQNLSTSAIVGWSGNMGEPHFPKQLNLELQSP